MLLKIREKNLLIATLKLEKQFQILVLHDA